MIASASGATDNSVNRSCADLPWAIHRRPVTAVVPQRASVAVTDAPTRGLLARLGHIHLVQFRLSGAAK